MDCIEYGFIGKRQGLKYHYSAEECDSHFSIRWNVTKSGTFFSPSYHLQRQGVRLLQGPALVTDDSDSIRGIFVVDRQDWGTSDETASKGGVEKVSARRARQFTKCQEECGEDNTAALVRNLLFDHSRKFSLN